MKAFDCAGSIAHVHPFSSSDPALLPRRRVEHLTQQNCSPSSFGNYYRAVILLLRWIVSSTREVTALGGMVLDRDQDRQMVKTLEAWQDLRRKKTKKAKRAGADHNRLEDMQLNKRWTEARFIIQALNDVVTPRLHELIAKPSLNWNQMREFFELLMYALVVKRPCCPCTYYSAYDIDDAPAPHARTTPTHPSPPTDSYLTDWTDPRNFDEDEFGNRRWHVTHIKTRDAFKYDAIIIVKEHIPFVDYYVKHIRDVFTQKFTVRKKTAVLDEARRHRDGTVQRIFSSFNPPSHHHSSDRI
jgi:hypothetical protein